MLWVSRLKQQSRLTYDFVGMISAISKLLICGGATITIKATVCDAGYQNYHCLPKPVYLEAKDFEAIVYVGVRLKLKFADGKICQKNL